AVEGDLNLAIVARPIADERLHVESVLTEPLFAALHPKHRLSRRRRITIQDLSAERFILLDEMHCLGQQVINLCQAHDCQPTIACRSAQISTVQALIALGQGVSLLPDMARRADASRKLVYRALANAEAQRTIAAVWHRHHYHGPAAEHFVAALRLL